MHLSTPKSLLLISLALQAMGQPLPSTSGTANTPRSLGNVGLSGTKQPSLIALEKRQIGDNSGGDGGGNEAGGGKGGEDGGARLPSLFAPEKRQGGYGGGGSGDGGYGGGGDGGGYGGGGEGGGYSGGGAGGGYSSRSVKALARALSNPGKRQEPYGADSGLPPGGIACMPPKKL
ncbi:MAG: hypothetical protein M1820_007730 [Bogoriella megaspora]|nr:MAG: hypothetical protein M1820_007730 [Bogoriella megaspora]